MDDQGHGSDPFLPLRSQEHFITRNRRSSLEGRGSFMNLLRAPPFSRARFGLCLRPRGFPLAFFFIPPSAWCSRV